MEVKESMIRYISIIEKFDIRIRSFEKTPDPQVLQKIMETNKQAIQQLEELMDVVDKLRKLGVPLYLKILESVDNDIYVHKAVVPLPGKESSTITIKVPKELLEKYKELDGKELTIETLAELRNFAKNEKEKAEKLFTELVNNGLVITEFESEEEEEEEDC